MKFIRDLERKNTLIFYDVEIWVAILYIGRLCNAVGHVSANAMLLPSWKQEEKFPRSSTSRYWCASFLFFLFVFLFKSSKLVCRKQCYGTHHHVLIGRRGYEIKKGVVSRPIWMARSDWLNLIGSLLPSANQTVNVFCIR